MQNISVFEAGQPSVHRSWPIAEVKRFAVNSSFKEGYLDAKRFFVQRLKASRMAAGTIGKVAEEVVPEDVEEDPQREDDHGAPQPTSNTMPQVVREESSLPAPEAGSAGPSDPVRPARGVDKAPVPAPEAETLEEAELFAKYDVPDDLGEQPKKKLKYLPNFEIIITKDNYEISELRSWHCT